MSPEPLRPWKTLLVIWADTLGIRRAKRATAEDAGVQNQIESVRSKRPGVNWLLLMVTPEDSPMDRPTA